MENRQSDKTNVIRTLESHIKVDCGARAARLYTHKTGKKFNWKDNLIRNRYGEISSFFKKRIEQWNFGGSELKLAVARAMNA